MSAVAPSAPNVEQQIALVLEANCTYRRRLRITLFQFPENPYRADLLLVVMQVREATVAWASTGEDLGNAILRAQSILIRGARFDLTPEEVQKIRETFAPHGLRVEASSS